MRAAMGCPAVPVVLGELGYFLDVADPRFVHAAAVNAGMVRLAAGDVASNPAPTPTPTPNSTPNPNPLAVVLLAPVGLLAVVTLTPTLTLTLTPRGDLPQEFIAAMQRRKVPLREVTMILQAQP